MTQQPETTTAEQTAAHKAEAMGRFFALTSAAFLGVNTSLGRLAYEGGSNPGTVVFVRLVVTTLTVALLIAVTRRAFTMPRTSILPIFGVAASVVLQGAAYMSSVAYIPVGLAVLLFYTYPLMVALGSWLIDRNDIDRNRMIALIVAFGGIGLAVGPSFHILDWRGIVLALLGAFGVMGIFLCTAQALKHVSSTTVSLYSNLFAVPMMAVTMMAMDGFKPPETTTGTAALMGVCILYALAILMQYSAIHSIGKTFTALFSNIEPLVSIAAGALLLGEVLSGIQYLGSLIVVTALVASDWMSRRSARKKLL